MPQTAAADSKDLETMFVRFPDGTSGKNLELEYATHMGGGWLFIEEDRSLRTRWNPTARWATMARERLN